MIKCKLITGKSPRHLEENVNGWLSRKNYGIYNQSLSYSMKNGETEPYTMSIFYEDSMVTDERND